MKRILLAVLSIFLVSLAPLSYAQEPGILYQQDFVCVQGVKEEAS